MMPRRILRSPAGLSLPRSTRPPPIILRHFAHPSFSANYEGRKIFLTDGQKFRRTLEDTRNNKEDSQNHEFRPHEENLLENDSPKI